MSSFPTPRRGETWLVDFSPQRGAEQGGQCSALVIQNDFGNQSPRYPNTILLAMSTKGRAIPFHTPVEPSELNGLRETTHIKCEQVLTLSKARLLGGGPLGRVESAKLREVEGAVKLAMALP